LNGVCGPTNPARNRLTLFANGILMTDRGGKLATPLQVGERVRQYGVCMEMADQSVREDYGRNPAHDEWNKAYSKVMVPGTTTFDIVGQ
jgi:hypothetical protein